MAILCWTASTFDLFVACPLSRLPNLPACLLGCQALRLLPLTLVRSNKTCSKPKANQAGHQEVVQLQSMPYCDSVTFCQLPQVTFQPFQDDDDEDLKSFLTSWLFALPAIKWTICWLSEAPAAAATTIEKCCCAVAHAYRTFSRRRTIERQQKGLTQPSG